MDMKALIEDVVFRNPTELSKTKVTIRRYLLIASCLMVHFPSYVYDLDGIFSDYIVFNNLTDLEDKDFDQISAYDFQIISLPLRSVLPDFFFNEVKYSEYSHYVEALELAKNRLEMIFQASIKYNREHGLLTFVCNFFVPQQNNMGRLLPKYTLRNRAFFIEKLNEHLSHLMQNNSNMYMLDADGIGATYGKRYFQDEYVWSDNHGSLLNDSEYRLDQARLEPVQPPSILYGVEDRPHKFLGLLWAEIISMYKTARGIDAVKMVIFDIDDTLWRGVMAEADSISPNAMEGWPLGLIDAIRALRDRGIILALASKNDEKIVESIWSKLIGPRLPITDFAIRKISWSPKVEGVAEILATANLLPQNVAFVDDNPVEREQVSLAFPDIRVIPANPYTLKRILIWSSETQVPYITDESAARNKLMSSQAEREAVRKTMSREEFLASLSINISYNYITSDIEASLLRALELLNKTNQFNTTGRRWSLEEIKHFLINGNRILTWTVSDRFSEYGLVGVALLSSASIEQMVMSCRVFGLEVETLVLQKIEKAFIESGSSNISARFVVTDKNGPCQQLFPSSGYSINELGFEKSLINLV